MFRNYHKEYMTCVKDDFQRLLAAGHTVDDIDTIYPEVHTIEPITLPGGIEAERITANATVGSSGGVIAFVCYTVDEEGKPYVTLITDCLYDKLSENAKRFVQAHEAGHILAEDLGTEQEIRESVAGLDIDGIITKTRDIRKEYVADEHAVKVLGKKNTLKAMREIQWLMIMNPWIGFEFKEHYRRMRHVKSLPG